MLSIDNDDILVLNGAIEQFFSTVVTANLTKNTYRILAKGELFAHITRKKGTLEELLEASVILPIRNDEQQDLSRDALLAAYQSGAREQYIRERRLCADGVTRDMVTLVSMMEQPGGGDVLCAILSRSVEELLDRRGGGSEDELVLSAEERYRQVMEAEYVACYEVDVGGNRVLSYGGNWAEEISRLINEGGDGFTHITKHLSEAFLAEEFCAEFVTKLDPARLTRQFSRGVSDVEFEYKCRNEKGMLIWVKCSVRLVSQDEKNLRAFIYQTDIMDQTARVEELEIKHSRDKLTGLLNVVGGRAAVNSGLNQYDGGHHATFYVDIDDFGRVNDEQSYPNGDKLLREVAERLGMKLRVEDYAVRVDGDRFLVQVWNFPPERVENKAWMLMGAIEEAGESHDPSVELSASIGVAISPEHGTDYDTLAMNAEVASRRVRQSGKNGVAVFS